jgi:hypothetical protein
MDQTQFCKTCKTNRPLHFFVRNNKPTKSCSVCRDRCNKHHHAHKRTSDTFNEPHSQVTALVALEDIDIELKNMAGSNIIEFKRVIDINEYSEKEPKMIAKMITEHIYDATLFKFTYHDHELLSSNKHRFRYSCAQMIQSKKPRKHADPSKHRDTLGMPRFDCAGLLKMTIDTTKMEIIFELNHNDHEHYTDVRVPDEVREYVRANLRRTPRQLWEDLGARAEETGNLTQKQVHHWWREYSKNAWKRDNDQVQSAMMLINEYNNNVTEMFYVTENGITAIAFGVKDFIDKVGRKAVEVGIDATCKLTISILITLL